MPHQPVSGDSFTPLQPLSTPPSPTQHQPPQNTSTIPPKPTDFSSFVVQILAQTTRQSQSIDQNVLRRCLGLSSSFLVTDSTTNSESGIRTWTLGFTRLVDVLVALHARNELELETVNAASRACSECWSAAGSWRGLGECREGVRTVAMKLKKILDPNGRTYQGQMVYAP